ncbi:GNAT family N-acetyltransferase [Natronococcus pandeyae]|uniref:GNAT family N-acetyltransferase n=1 Tax=Natronococcus pandeyae TaxID=2055836 RepID=A0A8J8Q2N2_9EURY|nr:GNAT family N-acetyltransferase [Natronococcus pandeyae]TYL37797.1 GNAT family N-acetyltransferase [Natronococcus pandeyae]
MVLSSDRRSQFPRLPTTFADHEGRTITVSEYTSGSAPLVEMYTHFDDDSRSQGLPPRDESRITQWIDGLLEDGLNVVARHRGDVVGHAVLVPYDDTSELAIFVRPAYQSAGIGTQLIRGLLGHGRENGLSRVWLTVSRTNRIAMNLYRSAGFETTASERGEHEMERSL